MSLAALPGRTFGTLPVLHARLGRDGWEVRTPIPPDANLSNWVPPPVWEEHQGRLMLMHAPVVYEKPRDGFMLRMSLRLGLGAPTYELPGSPVSLSGATWADWDRRGRLVFAADGCVFAALPPPRGDWSVLKLADFCANEFREVPPPPEALEW